MHDTMHVMAVAFDLDGTIAKTSVRFAPFRERIGCTTGDVLSYIEGCDAAERERMYAIIDEYERCIEEDCVLDEDFPAVMNFLSKRHIRTGIITRSSHRHAVAVMEKLGISADAVIGRDDITPKPSGEPLLLLSQLLEIPPQHMLFVGDFLWDVLAGRNAGVRTVLLVRTGAKHVAPPPDYTIRRLVELIDIITSE